ncbi:hypothetical protein BU26DRAFT_566234 [Trematosphaeria pertusa]|uniref:BTB domain-containing protein n=1 Tax=Trematosphaeria pertusa TaxID=390896 RepID=A0A6A6IA43_9PLEO|nr:uncharacterized protein BU26DRAFT_566234 [Trematosphaeria pertusa]KAF2247251.1 hypothetical protein BU26DRAFT_566234 [Trematosphaeria pertusa]
MASSSSRESKYHPKTGTMVPFPPGRLCYPEGSYYIGTVAQFLVPEDLICGHSRVIDDTVSATQPGGEKRISFPDIIPDHFNWYVQWLYTGRFFFLHPSRATTGWDAYIHPYADTYELAQWTLHLKLASELQDTDFHDALIDSLLEWIW